MEINPELGGTAENIKVLGKRERSNKKLSLLKIQVLRALLKDTLSEAGYENLIFSKTEKKRGSI